MRDPAVDLPALPADLVQWLPRTPLFRGLSMAETRLVASIGEEVRLEAGEELTRSGDLAQHVHLLYEGELSLRRADGEETRRIRPPEDYGLFALVEPRRWVHGTVALAPCRLAVFPADALQVLMESDESLGLRLWRNIARLQTFHFMSVVDRWAGVEPRETFNPYRR